MYVNALVDIEQVEIHTEKGEREVGESTYCRYSELLGIEVTSGRMCTDSVLRACVI
jgi:hypothetical protein